MATRPKSEGKSEPTDTRGKIVDALMELASERRFEEISVRDICKAAGVSLADFRDAFPSKGAVLAGFTRRIDRIVLAQDDGELADESARAALRRSRCVVWRRWRPTAKDCAKSRPGCRRQPTAALAMNQVAMNSMRFMLEAAGIEAEGASGAIKLQGLSLAWARVLQIWLDDDEPALSKTMAELDRVLTRGERAVAGLERVSALATSFGALAKAAFDAGRRVRRGRSRPPRKDELSDEEVTSL